MYYNSPTAQLVLANYVTTLIPYPLSKTTNFNSDFVGAPRDGLLWFYDRGNATWKGFFRDPCVPVAVPPGVPKNDTVECTDSIDPYINVALKSPTLTCSTRSLWAYSNYTDTFSKNCSAQYRLETVHRSWLAKSWYNSTIVSFNQTFSRIRFAPSFDTNSASQLGTRMLNCTQSTGVGIFPDGNPPNGDYAATVSFRCNDGVMQHYDEPIEPISPCPFNRTITRVWYYDDFCDGIQTYNQTLIMRDTGVPFITINPTARTPFDKKDPIFTGYPTYSDDCSPVPRLIVSWNDNLAVNGSCAYDIPAEYDRVWTVTDECGLSTSITQRLIVDWPIFNVPGSRSLECPVDVSPEIWGYANSTDPNCTVSYTDSYSYSDDCTTNNKLYYILYRTWNVTDLCGSRTQFQVFTVKDRNPPVISPLSDLILECDQVPDVSPLPDSNYIIKATANDSCIGPITVSLVETQPWKVAVDAGTVPVCSAQVLNARNTTRVYTAVDTCGNTASITQTITFKDTKAPMFVKAPRANVTTLTLPKEQTQSCSLEDIKTMIGNLETNITWADNCDPNLKKQYQYLGAALDSTVNCGKIIYTWKLTDWCSNVNNSNVTVTIQVEGAALSGASDLRPWSFALVILLWIFHLLRLQ